MNPETSKTVVAIITAIAAVLAGNTGMTYNNGEAINNLTKQNHEILQKLEAVMQEKVLPAISINAENRELNQAIQQLLRENTSQNAAILELVRENQKGKR